MWINRNALLSQSAIAAHEYQSVKQKKNHASKPNPNHSIEQSAPSSSFLDNSQVYVIERRDEYYFRVPDFLPGTAIIPQSGNNGYQRRKQPQISPGK